MKSSLFSCGVLAPTAALLLAVLSGCGGGGSGGPKVPTGTTTSACTKAPNCPDGSANAIVFSSTRDSGRNGQIYTMNPDGSAPTRLTNNNADDKAPSQSDATGRIVFQSNRDGNSEIYIMNFDGSGQTRLTNDPGISADGAVEDSSPAISPDGSTIAWSSTRGRMFFTDIWLMNADGSNQRRFTEGISNVTDDFGAYQPTFSPNGQQLAYFGFTEGMRSDRLRIKNIATGAMTETPVVVQHANHPRYSPDGSKIIFAVIDANSPSIYDVNSRTVTSGPSTGIRSSSFDYSPDGRSIVYAAAPIGATPTSRDPQQIFVMNLDGTNQRALTTLAQGGNFTPDW